MSKPETVFHNSINRLLKNKIYFEKMHNPYRSGTPDFWYSGRKRDLWVEYKYIKLPKTKTEVILPLSELQKNWLFNRYNEGRNVAVICGTDKFHGFFLGLTWSQPIKVEYFAMTKQRLAECLIDYLNEMSDELAKNIDYRQYNIQCDS